MELMNNDEVDKKRGSRENKRTSIQKVKLTDTPFSKCILSENIWILKLCSQ